jgi:hypothetical protein
LETTTANPEFIPTQIAASPLRQAIRYALHLAAIYLIVHTTTMWLAGRVYEWVLPLVEHHRPTMSSLQFAFSHLFLFSFLPAMLIAFIYSLWFPHRVALFVWIVPVVILAYKIVVFPASTLEDHWAAAFHQYFGGEFIIGEFHNYQELFQLYGSSDVARGMQQLNFTAPVYAAVGYGLGAWVGIRSAGSQFAAAFRKLKPGIRPEA